MSEEPDKCFSHSHLMQTISEKERRAGLLEMAVEAARLGADVVRSGFLMPDVSSSRKADSSVVTEVDVRAERVVQSYLSGRAGDIGFEGEESGVAGDTTTRRWVVDALDGTDNFVLGIPHFSTSIALVEAGVAVLGVVVHPITGEVFTADRGVGAYLNGNRLSNVPSKANDWSQCRVAFVPDFLTKRADNVMSFLLHMRQGSHRVVDTWAPSLDWCYLACRRLDMILQVASSAPTPNAGYLIAAEAGIFQHAVVAESFCRGDQHWLIAGPSEKQITSLIEDFPRKAAGRAR